METTAGPAVGGADDAPASTSARPARPLDIAAVLAEPKGRTFVAWLALVAVWFWAHPYYGIRHDGILYLGQALARLHPERFGADLFFAHGSQARFSGVDAAYAWLVGALGAGPASIVATAACNVAFVAAAWWLAGGLDARLRWFGALGAVVLPAAYARVAQFNVGEDFFTARSVAEPLVIAGLAAWSSRRRGVGGALLLLGLAAHPLVAIPGVVAAWCMDVARDRRWLWALAVLLPVAGAAAAGVAPFDGLFHRFDDAWWDVVRDTTAQVVMGTWTVTDLQVAVLDLVLLAVAALVLEAGARRLLVGVLGAAALLLPVAFVGGDLLRDVLVVQLQLWRVLLLVHLVAMVVVPLVAARLATEGASGRLLGAAAVAAAVVVGWTLPYASVLVAWLALAAVVHLRRLAVDEVLLRGAAWATWSVAALAMLACTAVAWRAAAGDPILQGRVHPAQALLVVPLGSGALALALWAARCRAPLLVAAALALIVGATGLARWDHRSAWHLAVETAAPAAHPFAGRVPPGAQVYWHTELLPTWSLLERASWVSDAQGSGVAFQRDTAMAYRRRIAPVIAMLRDQAACQMDLMRRGVQAECQPAAAQVEALCRLPDGPAFVVFDAPYPRGAVARWDYRIGDRMPLRTAWLHDCAAMR